jgi:hypothetical protein
MFLRLPLLGEPSQAAQLAIAQKAVRDEDVDGEALFTLAEKDIPDVLKAGQYGRVIPRPPST